ncbi:MAG: F0F1 ATP synthase subunit A [Vampirovibrionales bacterium]|nr:F0F1 ATP synthase subunit A [Vampirovibrionales bacterium]
MEHFWQVSFGNGLTVHANTVLMAWIAMGLLIGLGWLATRQLAVIPTTRQTAGEFFYDFCRSITMCTAGPRGDGYLFFVGSLFLFILTCNLMGQLPLKLFGPLLPHGELMAATADINTTAALAIISLVMYIALAIKRTGIKGFVSHHLQPHWLFLPMNLLEHITRPASLLIRLYFNILVGEILSGLAMSISPYVLPSAVIFLELFVAVVQAYIFAILSAVYVGLMTEVHDDHHADDAHAH